MSSNSKKLFSLPMIIALVLILGGGWFAYLVQTGGGDIDIRDVRFMGSDGKLMSALLYVPEGVNAKNKAPGILAIHGYINSRETQDGFAIEFARRGYVVLAVDQTGHGYSDPPCFANAFGGIDGLKYLRSLDMVDPDNIGLEGHSMGGWAAGIAAAVIKDGYKSFVMASSSTGTFGCPDGTSTWPRNMALIFSKYDDFSKLMWGAEVPVDIVKTDKLKKVFNTQEDVEVGKLYGSIEDGTARKLFQPAMIHPKVHFSREAIGNAVEWFQATLKGGNGLPPSDQTWYWKEFFTFVALIGMVFFIIAVGRFTLATSYFSELQEEPAPQKSLSGWGWWVGAAVMVFITIFLYFWVWKKWGGLPPKGLSDDTLVWPELYVTVIMFWAISVAIVSLVLFLLWHYLINKKKDAVMSDYGFTWKWGKIWKSFLLALIVIFFAHLSLVISDWLFETDYRLWIFAIKPLDSMHFQMTLGYIIPFVLYFLVLGVILHGQMRPGKTGETMSRGKEMIINALLLISPYVIALLIHYVPLYAGGTLGFGDTHSLSGIVMWQFIPIFAIIGVISTYFYRKTGHIYVGAFINAMLVTWVLVASQGVHYTF